MSDEPEAPPSVTEGSPPIPAVGEEKTKGKPPRRHAEPKPQALPTTEAGEKAVNQLQRKLIEMVNAAALTEANRRRATAIDATDCEAGFDRIAGPAKRERVVTIVADVATSAGTGLMGYAINVYTGSSLVTTHGHLAMIGGVILVVLGIILKCATQWGR
jgi:hypothetical protein